MSLTTAQPLENGSEVRRVWGSGDVSPIQAWVHEHERIGPTDWYRLRYRDGMTSSWVADSAVIPASEVARY